LIDALLKHSQPKLSSSGLLCRVGNYRS